MKSLEQLIYELRKEADNLSVDQLFLRARGEHYAALGSKTNTAATEHEMKADVYRMLAREKKEKEV